MASNTFKNDESIQLPFSDDCILSAGEFGNVRKFPGRSKPGLNGGVEAGLSTNADPGNFLRGGAAFAFLMMEISESCAVRFA